MEINGAALKVPPVNIRQSIPEAAILDVAQQIAQLFMPQKIILFGSYAYGTPQPESDVDLLVVMNTQIREVEQAVKICQKINYRFGLDLIVYTPERLAQRLDWGDSFLREVVNRGKILYESAFAYSDGFIGIVYPNRFIGHSYTK